MLTLVQVFNSKQGLLSCQCFSEKEQKQNTVDEDDSGLVMSEEVWD